MTTEKFIRFIISVFSVVFFLQTLGIRAGNAEAKISGNSSIAFAPFRVNSWFSYPSQVLQYWFPLFRPAYYPTNLQRPTAGKLPTSNQAEKAEDKPKPKTENIFGISGPSGDDVECLSPDKFEW